MKNPLVTFDDAVNGAADALVLWLWNEFEIKRWPLVRAAFLYAVAFHAVGMGAGGKLSDTIAAGVYALFMLGILAFAEKREASYPAEFLNAINISYRTSLLSRIIRLVQASFAVMVWGDWWLTWSCLQILGVLVLADTLTPTDPPRRKERKLVLAMARGGA